MDKFADANVTILFQFVENLLKENGISCFYLKNTEDIMENVDMGLRSGILEHDNATKDIQRFFRHIEPNNIYFLTDLFHCNYVTFSLPGREALFHCGPVLWEPMGKKQILDLLQQFELSLDFELPMQDYYRNVPVLNARSFYETIFLELMQTLYGDDYSIQYFSYEDFEHPIFDIENTFQTSDANFSNIDLLARRYEIENEVIQTVLSGKEILALEVAEQSLQKLPTLPSRVSNQLRNTKNYMLSFNTLLRKSIELNGVHPIYCDATSGEFAVEIEKCTSVEQLMDLYKKILLSYCKIAKKTSHLEYSPFVDTVLTYIEADLRADLSLKTLAAHLNVNASYLSALFSEEMGISLTNYVTKCRMEHAKKLLTRSNMTVKNIAFQCGFSDIHYFSRQFKKYTGLSPKAYREEQTLVPDRKIIEHLKKKK